MVLCISVFLGMYVFGSNSKWCPSHECNGNHCWCEGEYIEELGYCCFSCWKLDAFGEWIVYECCGAGKCEPLS